MIVHRKIKIASVGIVLSSFLILGGCFQATMQLAEPKTLVAPEPIADASGEFMNPYTRDGVLAPWVDEAINAQLGSAIGSTVGTYAGQQALQQIPFVGGFLGSKAGDSVGRKIAIEASGGWEYIRSTSDSSFDSVDDLAVYLYARHSSHRHFQDALEATMEIYPSLRDRYQSAIRNAPRTI